MKIGAITVLLAASLLISGMALGQSSGTVGAPTSAAGSTPSPKPLKPLPSVTTPRAAGTLGGSTSGSIRSKTFGTGKYDTVGPCNGSTGFGSSKGMPGRRC